MYKQAAEEIFNARGRILAFIANNPGCGIEDIRQGLFLTHRTVWGKIGELGRLEYIQTRRKGRKHYYTVTDSDFAYHICQIS